MSRRQKAGSTYVGLASQSITVNHNPVASRTVQSQGLGAASHTPMRHRPARREEEKSAALRSGHARNNISQAPSPASRPAGPSTKHVSFVVLLGVWPDEQCSGVPASPRYTQDFEFPVQAVHVRSRSNRQSVAGGGCRGSVRFRSNPAHLDYYRSNFGPRPTNTLTPSHPVHQSQSQSQKSNMYHTARPCEHVRNTSKSVKKAAPAGCTLKQHSAHKPSRLCSTQASPLTAP